MEIEFTDQALRDIKYWKKVKNESIQTRIATLLEAIQENPYEGIGNPEALKHQLSGFWSRRINHEHRLVYQSLIEKKVIMIVSLRFHY